MSIGNKGCKEKKELILYNIMLKYKDPFLIRKTIWEKQQNNNITLSKLILLKGNHLPTNTTTGLPSLSTPLWYRHPIPETSVKSSVFARRNSRSYLETKMV